MTRPQECGIGSSDRTGKAISRRRRRPGSASSYLLKTMAWCVENTSMSLSFLTGYVLGQKDASQNAMRAAAVPSPGGASTEHMLDVNERVDRLLLVVAALWSLLMDTGLTDQQLADRIREIDEADGVADGRMTPQATTCSNCGAAVSGELPACQFCGTRVDGPKKSPLVGI